jgi:SEC-C motif-containing protein
MKCPCHSEKDYKDCCGPYHKNESPAETPLKLMRSRYSAYALGLTDYIIETTHPESPLRSQGLKKWKASIEEFSQTTKFLDLLILSSDDTHVTFHAILSINGKDASYTEKSLFEKSNNKWYYVCGE